MPLPYYPNLKTAFRSVTACLIFTYLEIYHPSPRDESGRPLNTSVMMDCPIGESHPVAADPSFKPILARASPRHRALCRLRSTSKSRSTKSECPRGPTCLDASTVFVLSDENFPENFQSKFRGVMRPAHQSSQGKCDVSSTDTEAHISEVEIEPCAHGNTLLFCGRPRAILSYRGPKYKHIGPIRIVRDNLGCFGCRRKREP